MMDLLFFALPAALVAAAYLRPERVSVPGAALSGVCRRSAAGE